MSSMIGDALKISIFGQSHGAAVGATVDGLPSGEAIDLGELGRFLKRRAPGKDKLSTPRSESDAPRILSGLLEGKTCGAPLCAVIENLDARSADYAELADKPRPGHSDYTAHVRYGGHNDARGGGHFSGRLTAPLCVAGGIALQILRRRGIEIGAHIAAVEGISDTPFNPVGEARETLLAPGAKDFPVLDDEAGARMRAAIEAAASEGDSVGGIVECMALGIPAGLGNPMFGGVENRLTAMLFGIPAVRGVEFGTGFEAARMRGSRHNDPFRVRGTAIVTETNHHGGVLGGITSGMPVIFRAAFKPTPSISQEQRTVSLSRMEDDILAVRGRHDPCIVHRAVPCVEAAAALTLLDLLLLRQNNTHERTGTLWI